MAFCGYKTYVLQKIHQRYQRKSELLLNYNIYYSFHVCLVAVWTITSRKKNYSINNVKCPYITNLILTCPRM